MNGSNPVSPSFLEPPKTEPYFIPRTRLVWILSEEYVRSFWWLLLPVVLFGIFMLAVGQGALKAVGLICIGWPFSIPARSVISTGKVGELYANGCRATIEGEFLDIVDTSNSPKKSRMHLALWKVGSVVRRKEFLLVKLRTLGFVPIPTTAFATEEACDQFVRAIEAAISERTSDERSAAIPEPADGLGDSSEDEASKA